MSSLIHFGWNLFFENHYSVHQSKGLLAGRVAAILGQTYSLLSQAGVVEAELSGTLSNGKEPWELPKVGDWVVFMPYDEMGYIIDVLPRQNELARKLPGRNVEKQVIATNIDYAFILQGLDRDFNLMRLQRYLHQVYKSGIQPIVILNKSDLVADPEYYLNQVKQLGYECPVVLISIRNRQGLHSLQTQYLQEGKTYVLLGSSGVGKSSLLNSFLGFEAQRTGKVSEANAKGTHTTTTRNLIQLPNGSLIIDSPGMREFGITAESDEDAITVHPQIEALATHCRFGDCTHQSEPGCAVIEAVGKGKLPDLVYQSYVKLLREQYRFQVSAEEKRRMAKQFGRMSKEAKAYRKKRKY